MENNYKQEYEKIISDYIRNPLPPPNENTQMPEQSKLIERDKESPLVLT